jgi:hypothetical protein
VLDGDLDAVHRSVAQAGRVSGILRTTGRNGMRELFDRDFAARQAHLPRAVRIRVGTAGAKTGDSGIHHVANAS